MSAALRLLRAAPVWFWFPVLIGCGETLVSVVPVAEVRIGGAPEAPLAIGDSVRLTATGVGPGGQALAGREVSWSSTDTTVIRIHPTGGVVARRPGAATVMAEVEGQRASLAILVAPPPDPSIYRWMVVEQAVTLEPLQDIWGVSPNLLYAVGSGGAILRYDGERWTSLPASPGVSLYGVWVAPTGEIFAVGNVGVALVGDGTEWRRPATGTSGILLDVWGRSSADVYAVGSGGTILHFDGSRWNAVRPAGYTGQDLLRAIWGLDGADGSVYVGGDNGVLLRALGDVWTELPRLPIHIFSLWGRAENDLYAAGMNRTSGHGEVHHFDGTRWSLAASAASYFTSVHGTADGEVLVTGMESSILRRSSGQWTRMESGVSTSAIRKGWTFGPGRMHAVGDAGLLLRHDGSRWREAHLRATLHGVWGSPAGIVFVVGSEGTILRSEGAGWRRMESPTRADLRGVWGTSSTNVYAVGGGSVFRFDGSRWAEMPLPFVPPWLRAIWGTGERNIFAVGDLGVILRFDGSSWSRMNSGVDADLFGIGGTGAEDIYAVGASGTLLHFDGQAWSRIPTGASGRLGGVWATPAGEIFVAGETRIGYSGILPTVMGHVLQGDRGDVRAAWSGGTATQQRRHPYLSGLWGAGRHHLYAVGAVGTILRHDGGTWTSMSSPTAADLLDVWSTGTGVAYAVGSRGTILRGDR